MDDLEKGVHSNYAMQTLYEKYGKKAFTVNTFHEVPVSQLLSSEENLIRSYFNEKKMLNIILEPTKENWEKSRKHYVRL